MGKGIAALSRKRPQINIPLGNLELDETNPRLAREHTKVTQLDLLKILYDEFDLEEIAYSMSENGYFDEEPIVVVPKSLPKSFNPEIFKNIDELQVELQNLLTSKDIKFIVVEGNRRTAAAKLLLDKSLRIKIDVDGDFPVPRNKTIEEDLKIIPSIFYYQRADISPYLGVRHIAGILKWEAYAKAVYLAIRIEEEAKRRKGNIDQSIKEVQRQIGDRTDTIKKQYMCYKIVEQAEEDTDFDTSESKKRFSLVTVALNSPAIRNYIGVPSYKEADLSNSLVPIKKLQNLEKLFTWIFGNGKDAKPILTDSRRISDTLAPVLADDKSREYLEKYGNLFDAYERSGGERDYLKKKLNNAIKNIESALTVAYKYKGNKDIQQLTNNCLEAVEELNRVINKK